MMFPRDADGKVILGEVSNWLHGIERHAQGRACRSEAPRGQVNLVADLDRERALKRLEDEANRGATVEVVKLKAAELRRAFLRCCERCALLEEWSLGSDVAGIAHAFILGSIDYKRAKRALHSYEVTIRRYERLARK